MRIHPRSVAVTALVVLACLARLSPTYADTPVSGGKLVYAQQGYLYVAAISASGSLQPGKTPRKIARLPQGCEILSISVSADGNLIALGVRQESGEDVLFTVADRIGAPLQSLGDGFGPEFAPVGKKLAYTQGDERWETNVCIRDLASGKTGTLRPRAQEPHWTADGTEIALIDESKNEFTATVLLVDAATGKKVRFQTDAINVGSPLPSPDGSHIAFNPHMSRPKLPGAIADIKTGTITSLPHEGEPVLDWSPDSRLLLWARYIPDPQNDGSYRWQEIWTTTADGKHSQKIGTGTYAQFAPDGSHILYLRTAAREEAKPNGLSLSDRNHHIQRLLPHCRSIFAVWRPQRLPKNKRASGVR